LSYFSSATQIGLTATPKETKDVSNIDYFGEPIYTYSLKQGIEDGFLAPYKVIRVMMDRDEEGWRPTIGQKDEYGQEIPDEVYTGRDFDKKLILDERTKLVAKKVTEYLKSTDRFAKTIIFCEDIEHAERMRVALVNENADLVDKNYKYIMRITGDNDEGKRELDSFIDPASLYPAIVTTSKLLTTGVDVQTCKLVVLDSNIKSMTEFKQIIGRGTRIREDYGKTFFTIIDFRKVTNLFADPTFDGDPVQIYTPKPDEPITPPEDTAVTDEISNTDDGGKTIYDPPNTIDTTGTGFVNDKPRKYMVRGVPVTVIHERVQLIDANGKLITESLKDYSRASAIREYQSLDNFLTLWNSTERKQALIEEMLGKGIFLQELEQEIGKKLDPFDLVCHIAFDKPYLTRKQRAEMVKKGNYFDKYGEKAKEVIFELLDKYADQGIEAVEEISVLGVKPFPEYGTPSEIINDYFGGRDQYLSALADMEKYLYTSHQTL
jgi:type I restriction enzyme R subunit